MSRKLIFGIAVFSLLCILLAAPMHEAMEGHHVPFPADGDFGAMTVAMMVAMCTGAAALAITAFALMLGLVLLVHRWTEWAGPDRAQSPDHHKLLPLPPRTPVSLRI